ncbi:MAG: phage integrase N-terminal SAM-like domain-containing protein, partial [Candidatus Aquicultor sp.]
MYELIQRMTENMQLFGFSQRTQETYSYRVQKLIEYFNKPPDKISDNEIREYFLYLQNTKKYSRATMAIALCG